MAKTFRPQALVPRRSPANRLKMNIAKTQLMILCRRGKQVVADSVKVCIEGVELPKQEEVKYLGVIIDRGLNWKSHIDRVRKKSLACLASIRRAGAYLHCHAGKMLYQSFALPHLDYCAVVWNGCGVGLSDRIQRVQNYAMRIILRKPPRTSSEVLRQSLGWTSLKTRRQIAILGQVHRCINGRAPSYLASKFTRNSSLGYNCTRGANKLHLRQPQSCHYHSSLNFKGQITLISYQQLFEHYEMEQHLKRQWPVLLRM